MRPELKIGHAVRNINTKVEGKVVGFGDGTIRVLDGFRSVFEWPESDVEAAVRCPHCLGKGYHWPSERLPLSVNISGSGPK